MTVPLKRSKGTINAWPMNEAYVDYVEGKPDAGLINDVSFKVGVEEIEKSEPEQG